jgi:hypothetical protein
MVMLALTISVVVAAVAAVTGRVQPEMSTLVSVELVVMALSPSNTSH